MIVFDCSPALINRTAIYRLIVDTVEAWEGSFELSAFGRRLAGREALHGEPRVPWALRLLMRFPRPMLACLSLLHTLNFRPFERRGRTMFFDPLYTLFKKDIDGDLVWALDLTPYTRPDFHPPAVSLLYRRAFEKIRASRCRVVAISESTADDLRVNLGVADERLDVIRLYSGLKNDRARERSVAAVAGARFFLFVGSLERRKNLVALARAFGASGLAARGYRLAVVGGRGFGAEAAIDELRTIPGLLWLGSIGDAELEWLYRRAEAFVYPSLWEGFGVPLVEAMERGTVCLSTSAGASREVGGDAVLFCDPGDIRSIRDGLVALAALTPEEKDELRVRGLRRAEIYSWTSYLADLKDAVGRQS